VLASRAATPSRIRRAGSPPVAIGSRARIASAALALAAVLLVSACGGSGKARTAPASYVSQVCSSVGAWLGGIQSSSAKMSAQLKSDSTPADAKRALESLVGSAVADSERVVASLRAAGVPDVSNGATISAHLVAAFQHATTELRALQSQVRSLPTSPSAFRAGAHTLSASLQSSLSGIGSGLQGLHSPALEQAAGQSAACRNLGTASAGS
jgi:hypothetical protein